MHQDNKPNTEVCEDCAGTGLDGVSCVQCESCAGCGKFCVICGVPEIWCDCEDDECCVDDTEIL